MKIPHIKGRASIIPLMTHLWSDNVIDSSLQWNIKSLNDYWLWLKTDYDYELNDQILNNYF